eukprot:TRINITY_DN2267_c0_g1_i1.p1 TRINITY_DN2267_c0_g1~~TRINITY_DN2267_c0_g1_i1.p1  ORF type:complete len:179 (-),score=68.33 TRINITY_DN2267_c0_g1_i1:171-644(-)
MSDTASAAPKTAKSKKEKAPAAAPTRSMSRDRKPPQRLDVSAAAAPKEKSSDSPKKSKGKAKAKAKASAPKKATAGKKTKKEKDPNAPKRPLTAYMHFAKATRSQIVSKNPSADFREIGTLLGEAWTSIKAADKKKFDDAAEKDKKRYEKEVKEYNK